MLGQKNIAIAALLFLLPSTANANWQFTKWGMSPASVSKASNGATKVISTSEQEKQSTRLGTALLEMPYSVGNYSFQAVFIFSDSRRLEQVSLTLQNGDANILESDLRTKYGKPDEITPIPDVGLQAETWRTKSDEIQLVLSKSGPTSLSYSGRNAHSTKGL